MLTEDYMVKPALVKSFLLIMTHSHPHLGPSSHIAPLASCRVRLYVLLLGIKPENHKPSLPSHFFWEESHQITWPSSISVGWGG